jgi:methylated-DNA-[protein]-cysteine S-methyltransferase
MTIESRLKKGKGASAPDDAMQRVIAAAAREGLNDVTYTEIDSPLGKWLAATTPKGLVRVAFTNEFDDVLDELAERISPRVLKAPLDDLRRAFDDYFEHRITDFDLPLDWQLVQGFNRRVLQATAKIPYGGVSTYGTMARKAGSPRAARAAGNALHNNPIPLVVPCHRVIGSTGNLVGYGGGLPMKEYLLKLEGALLDG